MLKLRSVTLGLPLLLAVAGLCAADQQPICIDGLFDDWADVSLAYEDPPGDDGSSGVDFQRLWIADDDRFLFLRFEIGVEVNPSEDNNLRIYLDTDANSQTGLSVAGIGAELEWRMGDRRGTFYYGGQTTVYHEDIRFREGPTITASTLEVAFGRDTLPDGANPLFIGPTVRVALRDFSGDLLPETGDTVSYTFDQGDLPPELVIPLQRTCSADLRITTHNVLSDSPWDGGQESRFGRQLAAVAPDILNFQEIYDHSATQTAELVGRWVPLGPGESWHSAGNADCKTVSRYEIVDSWNVDANLAVLLDTTAVLGHELLIINAHLPCCDNDAGRQEEIDQIMAFIRDAQEPGGVLDLAPNTPILITGDLNLVGLSQQLTSLLTGDIVDEGTFGPDFTPDWDGSELANLIPRQTEKRMAYTWRNDSSSYWPGQLDYVIYADSVLLTGNSFVLYTPEMSPANLSAYGLLSTDSLASDHLLFCVDFRAVDANPGDLDGNGSVDLADLAILLANYGATSGVGYRDGDLDEDGDIDLSDLSALLAVYGDTCP
jgi:hypothetical protein